jgi:hypothetical protein
MCTVNLLLVKTPAPTWGKMKSLKHACFLKPHAALGEMDRRQKAILGCNDSRNSAQVPGSGVLHLKTYGPWTVSFQGCRELAHLYRTAQMRKETEGGRAAGWYSKGCLWVLGQTERRGHQPGLSDTEGLPLHPGGRRGYWLIQEKKDHVKLTHQKSGIVMKGCHYRSNENTCWRPEIRNEIFQNDLDTVRLTNWSSTQLLTLIHLILKMKSLLGFPHHLKNPNISTPETPPCLHRDCLEPEGWGVLGSSPTHLLFLLFFCHAVAGTCGGGVGYDFHVFFLSSLCWSSISMCPPRQLCAICY